MMSRGICLAVAELPIELIAHSMATSPVIPIETIQPHFMVVPSLACPAECSYCFGPHAGPIMSAATLEAALDFMARIAAETRQRKVRVTFHGGEPLTAGHALWRQALDGLASRFGPCGYKVALQSNLWLLDDEFCEMFRQHRVEIGTSLDGPEHLTDQQRGGGYFARTMAGIGKALGHGMGVGCIATFTPLTLPHWREVFEFFLEQRLGFSIHAAVPPLSGGSSPAGRHHIVAAEYAILLRQMLDCYIVHRRDLTISSLDQMCQGLGCGEGKVCTFRDCLGMFLAIDPAGNIYPCQRFCGNARHRLGSLADQPTFAQLLSSPTAQRFASRQQRARKTCDGCVHFAYCKGGCPYNAWASHANGETASNEPCEMEQAVAGPVAVGSDAVDPYCSAYRQTFDYIRQRLLTEMAAQENIDAIAERPGSGPGNPLLRKGPLIELVREGPHPSRIARTAKRIVAAVELAKGPDITAVAARLVTMGVCRTQQTAETSLANLWRQLNPDKVTLNNLYLHVTFGCQLRCTHCYAHASDGNSHEDVKRQDASQLARLAAARETASASIMPVAALGNLIDEAYATGFRQVIVTGGEPLTHRHRGEMLAMLAERRKLLACGTRKMNLVLRTNFAMPLNADDLRSIAAAFDQVVASVDGTEQTHDARRGRGAYAATVRNLETYANMASEGHIAELSLACVMRATDIEGEAGEAVRQLARRLGVRRTRFRPLLPLGRARDWAEPRTSEAIGAHAAPMELIEDGFQPVASCGLGQNLYVEPSGESFPCYAYHESHAFLGNVIERGLSSVVGSDRFADLSRHTVHTNPQCRACDLRYLCGGACRAWGGSACQCDLDAPPPECNGLRARAAKLFGAATEFLFEQTSATGGNPACSRY